MPIETKKKYKLKKIIEQDQIENTIFSLARSLNSDYKDLRPLILCVLDGASRFFNDLKKCISFEYDSIYVVYKKYSGINRDKNKSPVIEIDLNEIKNRHIILVDDIVDSGHCIDFFTKTCRNSDCLSVKTCCLINKDVSRKTTPWPEYSGFKIHDIFVVGYGMDYDEKYRDLNYIAELEIYEDC